MHHVMTTECAHLIDTSRLVKKEIDNDDADIEKEKQEVLGISNVNEDINDDDTSDQLNVNMNYVDDEILNEWKELLIRYDNYFWNENTV